MSQFASQLVVACLDGYTALFIVWCHLDLFDTTYYAAITIGKCNHVVQSGGPLSKCFIHRSYSLRFWSKAVVFLSVSARRCHCGKKKKGKVSRLESFLEIFSVEAVHLLIIIVGGNGKASLFHR